MSSYTNKLLLKRINYYYIQLLIYYNINYNINNRIIYIIKIQKNPMINFRNLAELKFLIPGYIPGGMPAVQIPPFGYIKDSNTTLTFIDMIGNLGSGILVIPLISLMEDVAICKAFGKYFIIKYILENCLSLCNFTS